MIAPSPAPVAKFVNGTSVVTLAIGPGVANAIVDADFAFTTCCTVNVTPPGNSVDVMVTVAL